ncbi:Cd(II)/Pb(II)-responsive transcriptional regulator [Rhodoferax mekongensis]|uniref:Cd(II)/Pb(II)-responsive transcriptional regulator n=1 Tax=Rhodoferax mekongensis TaxID=3068341 RepID=UPI0028BE2666|nr:Cd(II)/Pb(II)-responsive transcriptional regulator [Rhodoferax sp. TBRC 17199]MDT7515027.1 Cd(II)/Pb(II)-responsive transcriptional regulator [Rhodoferax sp. TBRC 17199]NBX21023.1 Cd(II)/Pb(II)-responsive transcriptional regulator [Betaproteobacteria bacterium]
MKIGDLAKATSTPVETIRYYEREGLLPAAARTEANYRHYSDAHTQRLQFVRHCRSLDMSLEEIRALLAFQDAPGDNCASVNALLDAHIGHVAQRIRELRALEKQLKALRSQCQGALDAEHCGILEGLSAQSPNPAGQGHLQGAHRKGLGRSA